MNKTCIHNIQEALAKISSDLARASGDSNISEAQRREMLRLLDDVNRVGIQISSLHSNNSVKLAVLDLIRKGMVLLGRC